MEDDQVGEIDYQFDLSDWMIVDDDDEDNVIDDENKTEISPEIESKSVTESKTIADKVSVEKKKKSSYLTSNFSNTAKTNKSSARGLRPVKSVHNTSKMKNAGKHGKADAKVTIHGRKGASLLEDSKESRSTTASASQIKISSLTDIQKINESQTSIHMKAVSASKESRNIRSPIAPTSEVNIRGHLSSHPEEMGNKFKVSASNSKQKIASQISKANRLTSIQKNVDSPAKEAKTSTGATEKETQSQSKSTTFDPCMLETVLDPTLRLDIKMTNDGNAGSINPEKTTLSCSSKKTSSRATVASDISSALSAQELMSFPVVNRKLNQPLKPAQLSEMSHHQSQIDSVRGHKPLAQKTMDDSGSIADIMGSANDKDDDGSGSSYDYDMEDISDTELSDGKTKIASTKRKVEAESDEPSVKKAKISSSVTNITLTVSQRSVTEPSKPKGNLVKKVVKKRVPSGSAKSSFGAVKDKVPVVKPKVSLADQLSPSKSNVTGVKKEDPAPAAVSTTSVSGVTDAKEQQPGTKTTETVKKSGPRIVRRFHRATQTIPKHHHNKLLQCLIKIPNLDFPLKDTCEMAVQACTEKVQSVFFQKSLPDTIQPQIFKVVSVFDVNEVNGRSISTVAFDYGISIGHVTGVDLEKSLFKENILTKADYYSLCFDSQEQGVLDLFFADEETFSSVITNIRKTRIGPRYLVVTLSKNLKKEECDPLTRLSHVKATIIFDQNFATTAYISHLKAPVWNKPKVDETMTIHNLPRSVPLEFLKLLVPDAISIELDDQNQQFTKENSHARLGMTKAVGSDHIMKLFTQLFINNECIVFSRLSSNAQDIPEMKDVLAERKQRQNSKLREIVGVSRDINELAILPAPEKEVIIMQVEDVETIDKVLVGRGSGWKGPSEPQDLHKAAMEDLQRTGDPNLVVINDDLSDISDTSDIGDDHSPGKRNEMKGWSSRGRKSSSAYIATSRGSRTNDREKDAPRQRERYEFEYHRHSSPNHSKDRESQRSHERGIQNTRPERSQAEMSRDSHLGSDRSQKERPSHDTYLKSKYSGMYISSPVDHHGKFQGGDKHYRKSPSPDYSRRRKSPELGSVRQRLGPERERYGRHIDRHDRPDAESSLKYGQPSKFGERRRSGNRERMMRGSSRDGNRLSQGRDVEDSRRVVRTRSPIKSADYRLRSPSPPRRNENHPSSALETRRISPSVGSGGIGKITIYRKSASPKRPPRSADLSPNPRPTLGAELAAHKKRLQNRESHRTNYSPTRRSPLSNASPSRERNRLSPTKRLHRRTSTQPLHHSPASLSRRPFKKSSLSPISAGDENENMGNLQGRTWTMSNQGQQSQPQAPSRRIGEGDLLPSTSTTSTATIAAAAQGDWQSSASRNPGEVADVEARAFLEKFLTEVLLQSKATETQFANTSSQGSAQSLQESAANVAELQRKLYGTGNPATDSNIGMQQSGQQHLNTSNTALASQHDPVRDRGPQEGGDRSHQAYSETQAMALVESSEGFLPPPIPPPLFTTTTSSQERMTQMEALAKQLAVDIQKQSQLSQSPNLAQEVWSVPPPTSAAARTMSQMTGPPPRMSAAAPNFGVPEALSYRGGLVPYPGPPAAFSGPPPPMRSQDTSGVHPPPPFWSPGGFF